MKKALVIALTAVLVFSFAACGKNSKPSIQPHYDNTTQDFIKWINTTDAQNYDDGKFKDFLTEIRSDGHIFVPYYKKEVPFSNEKGNYNISINPETKDEERWIGYKLNIDNVLIDVEIHYIDEKYDEITQMGFEAYVKSKRSTVLSVPTTLENWQRDPDNKNMYLEKCIINRLIDAQKYCNVTEKKNGNFITEFIYGPGFVRIRSNHEIIKNGVIQKILFKQVNLK